MLPKVECLFGIRSCRQKPIFFTLFAKIDFEAFTRNQNDSFPPSPHLNGSFFLQFSVRNLHNENKHETLSIQNHTLQKVTLWRTFHRGMNEALRDARQWLPLEAYDHLAVLSQVLKPTEVFQNASNLLPLVSKIFRMHHQPSFLPRAAATHTHFFFLSRTQWSKAQF